MTVALAPEGDIAAWYGGAPTGSSMDLIIDVTGYFLPGTAGAGYVAFGPQRVLDTRRGSGIPGLTGPFKRQSRKGAALMPSSA